MSKQRCLCLLITMIGVLIVRTVAHGSTSMDVLHYSVSLEPDIAAKSVKGSVRIQFVSESQAAEFNSAISQSTLFDSPEHRLSFP